MNHGAIILDALDKIDAALVRAGWPPTSPWWRAELRRFYMSGRRRFVLRVGRRGGKSSTLCRVAVAEAVFGAHVVPPGDIGVATFVSTSKEEAKARLVTIARILDALGVKYRPAAFGEGIDLADSLTGFRVFAASIAGVSGATSIALFFDEAAKWQDKESGANPARDVLASARPMMATMPQGREFLSSSPLGHDDAHARAFDDGETDAQVTAHAPSWIANPTLTEAKTHADEPDQRIWRREYAAEPQAGRLGAFDIDAVNRAFREPPENLERGPRCLILDPSSGRKDTWSWAIAGWDTLPGLAGGGIEQGARDVLRFELIDGVTGSFWRTLSGADVVARVAACASAWGVTEAHSDQRESLMLASEFQRHGLAFESHDWTSASKPRAVETVRRLFAESRILLPEHPQLKHELVNFEERITPSGAITFAARGSGHDDFVSLLITAAMAELQTGSFGVYDEWAESRYDEAIRGVWGGARGDSFGDGGGRGGDSFG